MKIAIVITTWGIGGAEKLCMNVANELAERHSIHIIYLKPIDDLKANLRPEISTEFLPMSIGSVVKLRKKLSTFDAVISHLGHADFMCYMATAGMPLKKISVLHNKYYKFNKKDRLIWTSYKRLLNGLAKDWQVVSIAKDVYRHSEDVYMVPENRRHYIPNCIAAEVKSYSKAEAQQELGFEQGKTHLLYLGRLSKQKNVAYLVEAANLITPEHNLVLHLVGYGDEEPMLRQLASPAIESGLLRFEGPTHNAELWLKACDAFIICSIFEGLPTVILEAFRAGIPVFCSDIPGNTDLTEDETYATVFPLNEAEYLARLMISVTENMTDYQHKAAMAQEYFKKGFTLQRHTEALEILLLA
jgi:glycosyltransferase involved in cell wall biosynthesis